MTLLEATATPDAVLTDSQRERLAELEATIARGFSGWLDVGRALIEIRDGWLYLATHPDYTTYLADRWGMSLQSAYAKVAAAECADAIEEHGGAVPAGVSGNAMRPLMPILHKDGPAAVASAWSRVMERHGTAERPPTLEDVRGVLVDAGVARCAPPKPRQVHLNPIGAKLRAAVARLSELREQLAGRVMPPAAREQAAEFAQLARDLAETLDAIADPAAAAARLAELDGPPAIPAGELCIGHGARRGVDGNCVRCRRPDLPTRHS